MRGSRRHCHEGPRPLLVQSRYHRHEARTPTCVATAMPPLATARDAATSSQLQDLRSRRRHSHELATSACAATIVSPQGSYLCSLGLGFGNTQAPKCKSWEWSEGGDGGLGVEACWAWDLGRCGHSVDAGCTWGAVGGLEL